MRKVARHARRRDVFGGGPTPAPKPSAGAPTPAPIRTEVDDRGVATITIDRPDAGNSLTAEMRDSLADTFDELSATLGVRAVVLTGAGDRHFCTGAGLGGSAAGRSRPGPTAPPTAPSATSPA